MEMENITKRVVYATEWIRQPNIWLGLVLSSLLINILSLVFPMAILQIYDRIIPYAAYSTLTLLIIGTVCAGVLECFLRILRSIINSWIDAQFSYELGLKSFKQVMGCSEKTFQEKGASFYLGELNSVFTGKEFHNNQLISNMVDFPFLMIFLGLLAYLGGWLVIIPLMMFTLAYAYARVAGYIVQNYVEEKLRIDKARMDFILEIFYGIHTIKSMAMETFMIRRYERLQRGLINQESKIYLLNSRTKAVVEMIIQLSLVFVVVVGGLQVIHGELTIGILAACTLITTRCFQPVSQLISLGVRLQKFSENKKKIAFLDMLPQEEQREDHHLIIRGDIKLEGFVFSKNSNQAESLTSVMIPANSITLLTGKTGRILRKIIERDCPSERHTEIDGISIADFGASYLRQKVAYISPRPAIFNGTILENITGFDKSKTFHDVEVLMSLFKINDMISQLADGYETILDDQNIHRYSIGFLQCVILARCLLNHPRVILIDKIDSGVDRESELMIVNALKELKGLYTILIASDSQEVKLIADCMYELDDRDRGGL